MKMKKNWGIIDKQALEAMQFIYQYCDMIDCCDDCIFHDEEKDICSIKLFVSKPNYLDLWEKREKEI